MKNGFLYIYVFFSFAFIEHLMSTRLDQPPPCCPTWTLGIHLGSWIRFTKEVCPTSNMVTKEISSTLGWKGLMVSTGELWIGSPFNMTAGVSTGPPPSDNCRILPHWNDTNYGIFHGESMHVHGIHQKKMCNFHDFLWQFTLEHVQNCCFFPFSQNPGNKPEGCVYHRVQQRPFVVHTFPPADNQSKLLRPSTGLQEHHFLDWWKKSDKVLLSTWAVDIAWRGIMLVYSCFFGVCGSTCHKKTCEGCWKWESTFSNLVSTSQIWWLHGDVWGVVIPPVVSSHLDDSPYLTRLCHVETMAIAFRAMDKSTQRTTCRWTKAYQSDIPEIGHNSNK